MLSRGVIAYESDKDIYNYANTFHYKFANVKY